MADDAHRNDLGADDAEPGDLPELNSEDFNVEDLEKELQAMMDADTPAPRQSCRALIVSPVDAPAALRAALDMIGSPAPVVSLGPVSAVFLDLEVDPDGTEEAEMLSLLGEDRPLPDEVDQMARLLSKLSKKGAIAIAAWTSKTAADAGEDALSGTIVARRYVRGEPEAALSSGLVLSGFDLQAEELLLGRIQPEDVQDHRGHGPWSGWLRRRGGH